MRERFQGAACLLWAVFQKSLNVKCCNALLRPRNGFPVRDLQSIVGNLVGVGVEIIKDNHGLMPGNVAQKNAAQAGCRTAVINDVPRRLIVFHLPSKAESIRAF